MRPVGSRITSSVVTSLRALSTGSSHTKPPSFEAETAIDETSAKPVAFPTVYSLIPIEIEAM